MPVDISNSHRYLSTVSIISQTTQRFASLHKEKPNILQDFLTDSKPKTETDLIILESSTFNVDFLAIHGVTIRFQVAHTLIVAAFSMILSP